MIQALSLLSVEDLQKLEVAPFVSLNGAHSCTVLKNLSTHDNQIVQLLSSKCELITSPQLYHEVVRELTKYYLAQNPPAVT